MTADLVIANATAVLPEGPTRADIVVNDEQIVDVADPGAGGPPKSSMPPARSCCLAASIRTFTC